MKALTPSLLFRRGPRALARGGLVLKQAPRGRRQLHAPRAVDGSVGNAAPLPGAGASSGLAPTPGLCVGRCTTMANALRRCIVPRPRLAVFPARCEPFALANAVHEARDAGRVDGQGGERRRSTLRRQLARANDFRPSRRFRCILRSGAACWACRSCIRRYPRLRR
jgi:hypothetical protein